MFNTTKKLNKNKHTSSYILQRFLSIFLTSIISSSAYAVERHVNTTIDDPYYPGSLRYEISQSQYGDSIVFEPHLYNQEIVLQPYYGPIYIENAITINGDINGDLNPDITISGNNQVQIFTINGPSYGKVLIKSLNLTKGFTSGSGGCITNYTYREVKLLNSTITNCIALRDGGGIFNRGRIIIDKSLIANNSASRGAGIVTFSGVQPIILDSTLTNNNSSRWGGAVYSYGDGTLHIERSIVKDNYARGAGAGVFVHGSTSTFGLKVINTTIANNFCEGTDTYEDLEGVGGGISAGGLGDVFISNSTLSNNKAGRDGGAIILRNTGPRVIQHTTVAFNLNDVGGLGPRLAGNNYPAGGEHIGAGIQSDFGHAVTLNHVLFSENGRTLYPSQGGQVDDVSGQVNSEGFNLFQQGNIEFSMVPGQGDILFGVANLLPLSSEVGVMPTHAISNDSQAYNAGNPALIAGESLTPLFDQRGHARINMGIIDIGAFEH